MKARFLQQQPALDVRRLDGKAWCYICANGVQITEEIPGKDGAGRSETVWEYDYNEMKATLKPSRPLRQTLPRLWTMCQSLIL